jgi:hypothetical protein
MSEKKNEIKRDEAGFALKVAAPFPGIGFVHIRCVFFKEGCTNF